MNNITVNEIESKLNLIRDFLKDQAKDISRIIEEDKHQTIIDSIKISLDCDECGFITVKAKAYFSIERS